MNEGDELNDGAAVLAEVMPVVESVGLDFAAFSEGLSEAAGLSALRTAAWERYGELSFPSQKTEEWRYTDLSKINFGSHAAQRRCAHGSKKIGAARKHEAMAREHRAIVKAYSDVAQQALLLHLTEVRQGQPVVVKHTQSHRHLS